jgi:hypothetical protein
MAEEERSDQEKVSLGIANELVEFANSKVDAGAHPMVVASALRHAAANFTAFAFRDTDDPFDTEGIMGDFLQFLHFYNSRYRGEASPMTGLEMLVKQVEGE